MPLKALLHFSRWQLESRIMGHAKLVGWTSRSKLWLAPGLSGATGNYYCGLHEFEDMSFLLHLLRAGDHFADVGANTGTYSVLAAAHCGARVTAFEPIEKALHWLKKNISGNLVESRVRIVAKAVSNQSGEVRFTQHLDAMNHLLEYAEDIGITVPCTTLDDSLASDIPLLMKIDVEGHENLVLQGGAGVLASAQLKAMIVETTSQPFLPPASQTTHDWLLSKGFEAFTYRPYERRLIPLQQPHHHNTLYLRDLPFIESRLQSAAPFRLWGRMI